MDHLMTIFLQRLPTTNIDTLLKVFKEEITFTKQPNPNRGGLMVPTQNNTMVPTYPTRAQVMPSQFIPMNLVPLQEALVILVPTITYTRYEPPKATLFE